MTANINISLEQHLLDALKPICSILPDDVGLAKYVTDLPPALIPYDVLHKISQWSRTDEGLKLLKSKQLEPQEYSMIALLAGTTTSPERKLGDYKPPKEPEELEAERIRERKTITALLNALLSIGGVGVGTYWAADKTGWKNEWRVLLALLAAIVVAISEAGLYIIWQSRRSAPGATKKKRSARHKKVDPPAEETIANETLDIPVVITDTDTSENTTTELRQRR